MNVRKKKDKIKLNWKIIFGMVLLVGLAFLVMAGVLKKKDKNENLDYKMGIVANDGVALVSISNERKMINVLNLSPETDVWIPNGLSWYRNDRVKNILEQEKKTDLVRNIFWYNFGFLTDKILFLNSINDWKKSSVLVDNLGFFGFVKYELNYGKMLLKEEMIEGKLEDNNSFLDDVMVRDFSETKLNNEELRLSVFNNTDSSGLASFMSERLEWSGFSVVSNDNNEEVVDSCLIVYGNKVDVSYGWKMINKIFNCEKRYDDGLNENELQIYFGDKLASMIQYSSYFR